jgi:hypothetical protein
MVCSSVAAVVSSLWTCGRLTLFDRAIPPSAGITAVYFYCKWPAFYACVAHGNGTLHCACFCASTVCRYCACTRGGCTIAHTQDMQRRERQLREMLGQLRITARSLVVPWDHVVCHLIPAANEDHPIGAGVCV